MRPLSLESIHWRFQKFKRKSGLQSLTPADMKKVRSDLHRLPKGNSLAAVVTLGLGDNKLGAKKNNKTSEKNKTKRRIQELSVKTWILDKAKNYLLHSIKQTDINDLIKNELYE